MIANAIGPQNTVGAIGIMPSTVDTAVSMIGRKRVAAGVDCRVPYILALRPFGFDLADQDHGILGDHAEERQDAENCDEAQRPARHEQCSDDADQPERTHAEHQEQALESSEAATIKTVSMMSSMTGTTAITEACDFSLSSTVPPTAML